MSSMMNRTTLLLSLLCAFAYTGARAIGPTPAAALLNATAKDITQAYHLLDLLKARTTQLQNATNNAHPHKQLIDGFEKLHSEMKAGVMPVLGTTQFTSPEELLKRGAQAINAMKGFMLQVQQLMGQTAHTLVPQESPTASVVKKEIPALPQAPQVIEKQPKDNEQDTPQPPPTPVPAPAVIQPVEAPKPEPTTPPTALAVTYDMDAADDDDAAKTNELPLPVAPTAPSVPTSPAPTPSMPAPTPPPPLPLPSQGKVKVSMPPT